MKSRILSTQQSKKLTASAEIQHQYEEYNLEDIPSWIYDKQRKENLEGFLYDEFDTLGPDAQPFFTMKLLLYCLSYKENYKNEFELGNLLINYQRYLKEGAYGCVKCVSDESKEKVRQIYQYFFSNEIRRHRSDDLPNIDGTELDMVIHDINQNALPAILERYRHSQTLNRLIKIGEE
jgi:hypothetical protein